MSDADHVEGLRMAIVEQERFAGPGRRGMNGMAAWPTPAIPG
jgi:hypothetical protein